MMAGHADRGRLGEGGAGALARLFEERSRLRAADTEAARRRHQALTSQVLLDLKHRELQASSKQLAATEYRLEQTQRDLAERRQYLEQRANERAQIREELSAVRQRIEVMKREAAVLKERSYAYQQLRRKDDILTKFLWRDFGPEAGARREPERQRDGRDRMARLEREVEALCSELLPSLASLKREMDKVADDVLRLDEEYHRMLRATHHVAATEAAGDAAACRPGSLTPLSVRAGTRASDWGTTLSTTTADAQTRHRTPDPDTPQAWGGAPAPAPPRSPGSATGRSSPSWARAVSAWPRPLPGACGGGPVVPGHAANSAGACGEGALGLGVGGGLAKRLSSRGSWLAGIAAGLDGPRVAGPSLHSNASMPRRLTPREVPRKGPAPVAFVV